MKWHELTSAEVAALGEDGLVWNMRILADSPLAQKYGYSEEASAAAPGKVADALRLQARRQRFGQFRIEAHQRYILTTYCETPAVLGGDPL